MKKVTTVMMIVALAMASIFANGAAETKSAEKVIINFGIPESMENPIGVMASEFQKIVEEKSNGNIIVKVFPSNQLGSPNEIIEAVQLGNQEMCAVTPAWVSAFVPQISILSLPYLFESKEKAYELFDGVIGDELKGYAEEAGIKILGFPEVGYRQVTNSKRPIEKLEDFQGIKIRVQGDPVHIAAFKALGANPVTLNFAELYSGLQQKVVEAQENSPTNIYLNKFNEVQSYLSYTNVLYDAWVVAMNNDFFNKLSPEYQKIITDAMVEVVPLQRKLSGESDAFYRQKLAEVIPCNEVVPEEMARMVEAARSVYPQFTKKLGEELVDKVLSALK